MENIEKSFENLFHSILEYVKIKAEKYEYKLADVVSRFLASLIAIIVVAFFVLFGIVLINIAFANIINGLTKSTYLGYGIISILNLVIGLIIWKTRYKNIQLPLLNNFIKEMHKVDENNKKS